MAFSNKDATLELDQLRGKEGFIYLLNLYSWSSRYHDSGQLTKLNIQKISTPITAENIKTI